MNVMDQIKNINDTINGFVWGGFGIVLLLGTGLTCTIITRFFQISRLPHIYRNTVGKFFDRQTHEKLDADHGTLTQFQTICTALAAIVGAGNITGVSTAICVGGPGAVFWMWIAAFFGMMTHYCENVLAVYYRRKNKDSEWSGGPMYYLKDGLGSYHGFRITGRFLAVLFCVFTILASFGIGNMAQVNKITLNIRSAFFGNANAPEIFGVSLVSWVVGIVLMVAAAFIVMGGLDRIASFSATIVPVTAILYTAGAIIIILFNVSRLPEVFSSIFRFAFLPRAFAGGITGSILKNIIDGPVKNGCKRGIFSNEAGLGSSSMIHSNSSVTEPVRQGMWGIFEVFFDTVVVCTATALVVLLSGAIDLETGQSAAGINDVILVSETFAGIFGRGGEWFVTIAITIFAFTTVIGWSQYGAKVTEYLFGEKSVKFYRLIFTVAVIFGAVLEPSLAWELSDTFNGLMMIPNLIGILALTPHVIRITCNYTDRRIYHMSIDPMLSYDPYLQEDFAEKMKTGEKNGKEE